MRTIVSAIATGVASAVVTALSPFSGVARADTPPAYHYDTTGCENSYYLMVTTAERARTEVPARFAIPGEAAGLAVAAVLITTCDVSLNGAPAVRATWSDVGVVIDPPGGILGNPPAIHAYRVWNVANLPAMVALNAEWGIATAEADVATAYAPGLPIATTSGFVESPYADYGAEGIWGGIVHAGVEGVVSWWSEGPAGLVRFDQAYTNDTEQCGVGVVTGEGRLGALIGGTGLAPHGCVVFADLIGDAVLVEPAP